jgi:hypothetical protein
MVKKNNKKKTARHKVEAALKQYREIKQKIEIIKENIKLLKSEIERVNRGEASILSKDVIKTDITKIIEKIRYSTVEKEVFRKDNMVPADREYIQSLINRENDKLNQYKAVIKAVNLALKILTDRQRFTIEAWYFDPIKYNYEDMRKNYNRKFKKVITNTDTIRLMKHNAINKLEDSLKDNPYIMLMF